MLTDHDELDVEILPVVALFCVWGLAELGLPKNGLGGILAQFNFIAVKPGRV